MKNRINLYLEQLKPVKEVLPLSISVAMIAMACLVVLGLTGTFYGLNHLQAEQQVQLDTQHRRSMAQLDSNIKEYAQLNNIDQLLLEKSKLLKGISQNQAIFTQINKLYQQHKQGFSPIFTALSSLKSQDVWLTGVNVDHDSIKIDGGAIRSQDIPLWIDGLKDASVLVGKDFSALEIMRHEDYLTFTLNEQVTDLEGAQ